MVRESGTHPNAGSRLNATSRRARTRSSVTAIVRSATRNMCARKSKVAVGAGDADDSRGGTLGEFSITHWLILGMVLLLLFGAKRILRWDPPSAKAFANSSAA